MNKIEFSAASRVLGLAALCCAGPLAAQEMEVAAATTSAAVTAVPAPAGTEVPAAVVVRRNPFGSSAVTGTALAARRGGDRVFNDNKLKGVVADNKASNLTTGMNVISEGAFTGSSGLPTVIQNSGNNVLIQNSTIVNVQVK